MKRQPRLARLLKTALYLVVIAGLVRIVLLDQCVAYLATCKPRYASEEDTLKVFEDRIVGMGQMSRMHTVAELLGDVAFSFELNQLARAKDPTLKCYAFWLLAERNEKELVKRVLQINHNDTTAISFSGPCIGWDTNVNELMVDMVTNGNRFPFTRILGSQDLKQLGLQNRKIIHQPLLTRNRYQDWWLVVFGISEVIRE